MKRATINVLITDLPASKAEISAAAIASTNPAAISAAFRKLFNHAALKGKRIHSMKATISLINLDQKTIEEMLDKADGITDEPEESSGMETCKFCHEQVESLSRHLATCPTKGKTA